MIRPPPRSPLFPYTTLSRPPPEALLPSAGAYGGNPSKPPRRKVPRGTHPSRASADGKPGPPPRAGGCPEDRKSTRLNSSHLVISYAVFCLKKKKKHTIYRHT